MGRNESTTNFGSVRTPIVRIERIRGLWQMLVRSLFTRGE